MARATASLLLATLLACSGNEPGVQSGSGASGASGTVGSGQTAGQAGGSGAPVGASGQADGGGDQTGGDGSTRDGSGQTSGDGSTPDGGGQTGGDGSTPDSGGQTGGDGSTPDGGGQTGGDGSTPDGGGQTGDGSTPDGGDSGTPLGSSLALCSSLVGCVTGQPCAHSVSRPLGYARYEGHCLPFEDGAGACALFPDLTCNAGYGCNDVCVPIGVVGDECDINEACPTGSHCIPNASGTKDFCMLDGQRDSICRATSPYCDTGLGCTSNVAGQWVCEPLIANNQACGFTLGCPDPNRCVAGPGAGNVCAIDGQVNGLCLPGGTCNAGLLCVNNRCVQPDLPGASCTVGVCATNSYCDINRTCAADGAQGTPCRTDGSCDTGLTCASGNVCEPAAQIVADGAQCNGAASRFCMLGSTCLPTTSFMCVPDGIEGGRCRASAPACDVGLACSYSPPSYRNTCAKPIAIGQPCMVGALCVAGADCMGATSTTQGSCIAQGAAGGACKPLPGLDSRFGPANQCDAGLTCWGNVCRPATIPAGMTCNPSSAATAACAGGAECINTACVAAGKLGGLCRPHDPNGACDTLLGCQMNLVPQRCVLGQGDGAACSASSPCALPEICATPVGGQSKCMVAGYSEETFAANFADACTSGVHVQLTYGSPDPRPPAFVRAAGHSSSVVNIPFPFTFWGSAYTGVWPSTRGVLYFGTPARPDDGIGNGYLPTDTYGAAAAPFWDDIYLRDAPGSDICLSEAGTTPNREFVVEWAHAGRVGRATVDLTFEIVLHETSNVVELVYGPMSSNASDAPFADGSRAAIGLQSGNNGVAVTHVGAVAGVLGIRFTPK